MPHLIDSFENTTVADARIHLQRAHDYLVECAKRALADCDIPDFGSWGASMKRIKVELHQPPFLIPSTIQSQPLMEVINQAATVERLLDALTWIASNESGFSTWNVAHCHPTTSSYKQREEDPEEPQEDNDLVLRSTSDSSQSAFFEVSDVASDRDGNGKEKKDLTSLRILQPGDAKTCILKEWPTGRRFLIVSKEFAAGLLRRKPTWIKSRCHYETREEVGGTTILEVCQGPRR